MPRSNFLTWDEVCAMLKVSSHEEDDALSSVIRAEYLTPISLGERAIFRRSEVERVAEMFGLQLEGDKQEGVN